MKQTPEEILDDFIATVIDVDTQNDVIKSTIEQGKKKSLTALEEAYTLSEEELIELLPKKYQTSSTMYNAFNLAIESCIKALRGKVRRGLSIEEIENIINKELNKECQVRWKEGRQNVVCGHPMPCPKHTKREEWKKDLIKSLKDSRIYKAQENKVNQRLLEVIMNMLYWKKKADTTAEMLLSNSSKETSLKCAEIMLKYEDSFKIAQQAIKDAEENNGK